MPRLEESATTATGLMAMTCDLPQIEHQYYKPATEEDGLQAYRMESFGLQAAKAPTFSSSVEMPEPSADNNLNSWSAAAFTPSSTLPDFQITEDHDSSVIEVGKDLAAGAIDELTNHPGRVIASAAIGLGVGIGATFVSPVVIGAGLVAAGGYGLYTLANKVPTWIDAAKVVSNPNNYSRERKMMAHSTLQDVGAGTVTLVASAIGALGTAPATAAIKSVFPSMARTAGHNAGSTFGAAIFDDVVVPIVATRGKDGV
jgi:hypothetical protein